MFKKTIIIIYLLGFFYLLLPPPKININVKGFKSQESGDTGQIKNIIAAYYTNQPRQKILDQAYQSFNHTYLFGQIKIPLLTYVLEHPPEYARQVIIDTHRSWHFKEFVHWQRESLFVSFWEPAKRNQSLNLSGFDYILVNQQKWKSKVTFYYIRSNPLILQVIWLLEVAGLYLVIILFKQTIIQLRSLLNKPFKYIVK
ncbi:MAG: hypothetical protein GXP43_02395 [bacterium]|nr:hypothetical protein [bacterium]